METQAVKLTGVSLIGANSGEPHGPGFYGINPANGAKIETAFYSATSDDIDRATNLAADAFPLFASRGGKERAGLLRRIADGLTSEIGMVVERAHLESGLPLPRLKSELHRTTGQLRLFAEVLEEGSWVNARIDEADSQRKPPRPDIRSLLRPLGPVAVFGASNFPLAFSVAGGDTGSALAAGNPVVVKAHPAHPGTSELVGRIIQSAVSASGLPAGLFSLLFDNGYEVGAALVQHPGIRAVGFTGSLRGGRALMDLAAARPDPIPVYAEMGSTNPVFILPGALQERGEQLADGLFGSFTLGGGQMCTKPGIVFAGSEHSTPFTERLRTATQAGASFPLLTGGIASNFKREVAHRESLQTAAGKTADTGFSAQPILLEA